MLHLQGSRGHGTHQVTEGQKPEGKGKRWRTVRDHSEKAGMEKEEVKAEGRERDEGKKKRNVLKTISEKTCALECNNNSNQPPAFLLLMSFDSWRILIISPPPA